MEKSAFIQSLFETLSTWEYVLLKSWGLGDYDLQKGTDLDILLRKEKLGDFKEVLLSQIGANFREKISPNMHQFFIFFENGDFLQIDILFGFFRKEIKYLATETIFNNHYKKNGLKLSNPQDLLVHVFLFNLLNKAGIPKKYISYFSTFPKQKQKYLIDFINEKYKTTYTDIEALAVFQASAHEKVKTYLNAQNHNSLIKKLNRQWQQFRHNITRASKHKGMLITFSGVDGAGKSTLIKAYQDLLTSKYRQLVIVKRHRPSIVPILSAWKYGKKGAEARATNRLPRQGTNQSKTISILRFAYYYLDYLFGQVYDWIRYRSRGIHILYDRYYFDFMADPKRSNLTLPTSLTSFFYTFLSKPKLNFFLYAPPNVILARKKELSTPDIVQMTQSYLRVFNELDKKYKDEVYLPIQNMLLEDTLDEMESSFLKTHYHFTRTKMDSLSNNKEKLQTTILS